MAPAHDLRETLVVHGDVMLGAALAAKMEREPPVANEADVTIAQRGKPIARIAALVLRIADANPGGIQQRNDQRENFFARQLGTGEIAPDAATQPGQRGGKGRHPIELGAIALNAPLRMVTILLAAACVAASGLQ